MVVIKWLMKKSRVKWAENQLQQMFRQYKNHEHFREHPGLFVSRGLVQLMGGKLNIKSSDTGATFSFSINCNPCEISLS